MKEDYVKEVVIDGEEYTETYKASNNRTYRKKKNKKLKSAVLATSEPKLSEAGEFLGEFFNVHSFKMHPTTMRFVESEARRLKEWSQLDTSLRLADFVDGQGYSPEIFYQWCRKSAILRNVHQYALRRIGARRENGALSKQLDVSTVHRTLGHYDSVWKSEAIFHAKLKDESEKNETKVVVIERFPVLEDKVSSRTPEEVAQAARRSTSDSRCIGGNEYEPRKKKENDVT